MDDEIELLLRRLPEGWFPSSGELSKKMEFQLDVEMPPGHLLSGRKVKVIAHRTGTDDILCWHPLEPKRFTVIHLVWSPGKGFDHRYPTVEVDGSFDDFLRYENRLLGRAELPPKNSSD